MKKFFLMIMVVIMVFAITACKGDDTIDVIDDIDSEVESAGLIEDIELTTEDGTIDFKDFTISVKGYEFSKKESVDNAEVYTYTKNDDFLDISQEGFEWGEDDFAFLNQYKGKKVEINGVEGYTAEPFDGAYSFVFNMNGRAWQILCSNQSDLETIIQTINKN